jgi:6-phosphofructokinase 1
MKNIILAQSGGPTAVINSSLAGAISASLGNFDKIYGAKNGIEGVIAGNLIELQDMFSSEKTRLSLSKTPASFLGTCRYKLSSDVKILDKIFETFEKFEVSALVYIGGNDSMDTVHKLSKYAMENNKNVKIIGVPKTIDNDLAITHHCPGFGSAAKYVATTMREIALDCAVYNYPTLTVVEIMGRHAGWLTAASALARNEKIAAPHYIYLPERVFDMDRFLLDVERAILDYRNVVIAVSEGIKTADGKFVSERATEKTELDAFGHVQLSGTASVLCDVAKKRFEKNGVKVKCRACELSIMQRAGAHIQSEADRKSAFEIGKAAVLEIISGSQTGVMAYFINSTGDIGFTDTQNVANAEKTVPLEWINDVGNDVLKPASDYITPLILGESYPEYSRGLPDYIC